MAKSAEKILFLIAGVSGSGKTTLAKLLATHEDDVVLAADDYFSKNGSYQFDPAEIQEAHNWCIKCVESAMKISDGRIFVTNTFTREIHTNPYRDLAAKYGYQVFDLVVLNTHGSNDVHGVSHETKVRQSEELIGRQVVLKDKL